MKVAIVGGGISGNVAGYYLQKDHDVTLYEANDYIGGHTHTFLDHVEMYKNAKGQPVLINQVGWAGLILGRIDFYFKDNGAPDLYSSMILNTNYELT